LFLGLGALYATCAGPGRMIHAHVKHFGMAVLAVMSAVIGYTLDPHRRPWIREPGSRRIWLHFECPPCTPLSAQSLAYIYLKSYLLMWVCGVTPSDD
jgi:hypothetical protein